MIYNFIKKQFIDIYYGGLRLIIHKSNLFFNLLFNILTSFPFYFIGFIFVIIIRLLEPILLIRIGYLISSRIGHFAGNTELYLCEKDLGLNTPKDNHIDLFYLKYRPICNIFLEKKFSQLLNIYPKFLLQPIYHINKIFPNFEKFEVGQNFQHDRDIKNLLDKSKIHLKFTNDEIELGNKLLERLGIPSNAKIVCLLVRDSSYLFEKFGPGYEYHNFRDSSINNYILAAEELAKHDYYVVRMGEIVKDKLSTNNSKIIDYANHKIKSPFLDIYLGYKCVFAMSTSSGWDAVPSHLFKKPILYTNYVPIALMSTFSDKYILTTKKIFDTSENKILTFKEIYDKNISFLTTDDDYIKNNLVLIENTPEEIKEAAIEMHLLINNKLIFEINDLDNQYKFWNAYPKHIKESYYKKRYLHGELKAIFSPFFLRNNINLLE